VEEAELGARVDVEADGCEGDILEFKVAVGAFVPEN